MPAAEQPVRQLTAASVGWHPIARLQPVPVGGPLAQVDDPGGATVL
jgi:hypothetical protein